MSARLQSYLSLAGRFLIAELFLLSAGMKLLNWSGMVGYTAAHGLQPAELMLALAVVAELGGGLLLLAGYRTRLAALGLFLYLIPATFLFHNFWAVDAAEQTNQMLHFLKNLALMGGLLQYAAAGAGGLSLDAVTSRTGRGVPHGPTSV